MITKMIIDISGDGTTSTSSSSSGLHVLCEELKLGLQLYIPFPEYSLCQ